MRSAAFQRAVETASVCERGLVRSENQDSVLCDAAHGVFAVADGMGGGQGGARASELVIETLRRETARTDDFPECAEAVRRTIGAANAAIRDYARKEGFRQTGSTVAAFILGDAVPGPSLVAWVGDSRIYRLRDGELQFLTRDHTVANEFFGAKGARDGSYDRSLPYAHVLTRALGVETDVAADWRRCEIRPGDRLLVCSDGVHDMLPTEAIRSTLAAAASAEDGVRRLSQAVCAAGAHDNFTAVLVFVKEAVR